MSRPLAPRSRLLPLLTLSLLAGACTGLPPAAPSPGATSGPRLVLHLVPGPSYSAQAGSVFYRYTVQPQVAAWLETPDGRYLDTIYATAKGEGGAWMAAPAAGRPEALPVWFHLRSGATDAVSSATATGETRHGTPLAAGLPPGRYVVMLETNRSYDWNEAYPKRRGDVSGQPSVVHRAEIEIGGGRSEASFVPVGRGSPDGKDGRVRPGLEGLDTALGLFSSLGISFEPE